MCLFEQCYCLYVSLYVCCLLVYLFTCLLSVSLLVGECVFLCMCLYLILCKDVYCIHLAKIRLGGELS